MEFPPFLQLFLIITSCKRGIPPCPEIQTKTLRDHNNSIARLMGVNSSCPLHQVTFIDQQHPEVPLAAVPKNFFPARTRVKLIEGYSDPKDTRASRSGRCPANSAANKPHRHHSSSGGAGATAAAASGVAGQVSKGDFRNYSNLTAPVPKSRHKSRSAEKGATKRSNRRKVSDSGEWLFVQLLCCR